MIKKIGLIILIIIFLAISSVISPPYAIDNPNETDNISSPLNESEYELYDSNIWSETHNSVDESESHFLDLGTRTLDGSMHIYLKSQAPASNYELNVKSIELQEYSSDRDTKKGIVIKANVEQTEDIGSTVITNVDKHIHMKKYVQTDVDFVKTEITDGWGNTQTLEREACGCVLKEDPIIDN